MEEGGRQGLDETLTAIQGRWGQEAIFRLGGRETRRGLRAIPTGVAELDRMLGCGGLPLGRLAEVIGRGSAGHLTLAAHILEQAQGRRMATAYIDMRRAIDPDYLAHCGVRLEGLVILRPHDGVTAMGMACDLCQGGGTGIIVVERTQELLAGFDGEGQMARVLRRMQTAITHSRWTLLFVSDSDGRNHRHSPLAPFAGVRLYLEQRGWELEGKRVHAFVAAAWALRNGLGELRGPIMVTIPICRGEE